jgi:hypothetical protein
MIRFLGLVMALTSMYLPFYLWDVLRRSTKYNIDFKWYEPPLLVTFVIFGGLGFLFGGILLMSGGAR